MTPSAWERLAGYTELGLLLALVGGAYGAAFGWRPGAMLMIGAVAGKVLLHVTAGLIHYRATMQRPWPKVRPLEDDDDW